MIAPRLPGQDPRWPNRNIRILFVDNEKAFVDALSHRLVKNGFFVSTAYSGKEGIELLEKASYDVAVLDLDGKRLHGISVMKKMHKVDPNLPVIMLTGRGCEKVAQRCKACGAFDFLTKPCEFENLLSKINYAYYFEMEPLD